MKTLYLIRHAQSEENVKIQHMCEGFAGLGRFQLPSWHQTTQALSLLTLPIDSAVSELGGSQINDMASILRANDFWNNAKPDIVVHSPLIRARETLKGLIPETFEYPVEELECLREATPIEHALKKTFLARVHIFLKWVDAFPGSVIVVVGHCQFYKEMLKLSERFRNCDVWHVNIQFPEPTLKPTKCLYKHIQVSNLQLLYRTELAEQHPMEKLYDDESSRVTSDTAADACSDKGDYAGRASVVEVHSDGEAKSEDPQCRICQVSRSEAPNLALIRPCMCTGTIAHVHIVCLNRWRESSASATVRCQVCLHVYNVQKSIIVEHMTSFHAVLAMTIMVLVLLVCVTGYVVEVASLSLRGAGAVTPAAIFYHHAEVDAFWSSCSQDVRVLQQNVFGMLHERAVKQNSLHILFYCQYLLANPQYLPFVFACSVWGRAVDVFVTGGLCVGSVGLACWLWEEVRRLGSQYWMGVAFLAAWVMAMGNKALMRLALVIGCAIAAREMLHVAQGVMRRLTVKIGERIMEPSRNTHTH